MSQKGQGNHLSKMIMMATKHLAGTSGTSSPAPPYCFASSHTFAVAKNLLATATKFVATAAKFRRRGGKFRRRGGLTSAVAAFLRHDPACGLRLRVLVQLGHLLERLLLVCDGRLEHSTF